MMWQLADKTNRIRQDDLLSIRELVVPGGRIKCCKSGNLLEEEYREDGIFVRAYVDAGTKGLL